MERLSNEMVGASQICLRSFPKFTNLGGLALQDVIVLAHTSTERCFKLAAHSAVASSKWHAAAWHNCGWDAASLT